MSTIDFTTLTGPQLVAEYNAMASALGEPTTKRFSSRSAGIERCQKLAERMPQPEPEPEPKASRKGQLFGPSVEDGTPIEWTKIMKRGPHKLISRFWSIKFNWSPGLINGRLAHAHWVEWQNRAVDLTGDSMELFRQLAQDAPNWGGTPLLGGNVLSDKVTRGNLTDLKRKGLVTTDKDGKDNWVLFTSKGKKLATTLGYSL